MGDIATEQPLRVSGRLSLKGKTGDFPRKKVGIDVGKVVEERLLADGWDRGEYVDEAPADSRSTSAEIARVKDEIIETVVHDPVVSPSSIGSRVSPDVLQKLAEFGRDARAKRIRDIILDPTKNSKQILKTLNAMKNEGSSNPKPVISEKSGESLSDIAIIADTLSRVDTVKASSSQEVRPVRKDTTRNGKVPIAEVKEYLSELVLDHFFEGIQGGRFDKGGVPHLSLDTLLFRDGRPLLNVIASKERSAVARLLKDIETELEEVNESEMARRRDIFNGINIFFPKTRESIEEIGRARSLKELEVMRFPFPMRKMRELGLDELPKYAQAVFKRKQRHALKEWTAAKDEARKRLGWVKPKNRRISEKTPDVVVAASEPIEAERDAVDVARSIAVEDEPIVSGNEERVAEKEKVDSEVMKEIVTEKAEEYVSEILSKIKEAENSKNRTTLSKLRDSLFSVSYFNFPFQLNREQKKELKVLEREIGGEKNRQIKNEINRALRRMILTRNNTSGFYSDLELISDIKTVDGETIDGSAWRKKLSIIAKSALGMSEEKFKERDWEETVPEFLRDKFFELLKERRSSEQPDHTAVSKSKTVIESGLEENEPRGKKFFEEASDDVMAAGDVSEPVSPEEKLLADEMAERASVDSGMEDARERVKKYEESLAERKLVVERLRADAKERSLLVAELESERQRVQGQLEKAGKQSDIYRKVKEKLGKFFGSDTVVAKKLQDEENQNQKYLEELDERIARETLERNRVRAKLKEAENDEVIDIKNPGTLEQSFVEPEPRRPGKESAKPENPKKEGKIHEGVASRFVGEFGIERSDLEGIDGFGQLSEGQQMLVFENLKQLTLGRIQEEAEGVVGKEMSESGFLGRIWKSVSKKYQIARAEKATAERIFHGGIEAHGKILTQLVVGMRDMGPEAEIGEDGKTIEMKFFRAAGTLSEGDQLVVDDFNRIANEFSRMPYEWSLPTASDDDRERYVVLQDAYNESLHRIQGVIYKSESIPDAHLIINDVDGKVQMMQFLQTHPELEGRLNDLKEQSAWRAMLNTVVAERGAYFTYGYVGRTLLAGALGWVAAPVVAAGAGGFMSWKRAKETLQSSDIAARRGKKDTSAEAKNVVTVKGLSDKLERLVQKLEAAPEGKRRASAVLSLKTRMEYTRRKVEEGLVDFGGKPDVRVWEQYDLLQLLARAEAIVGVYSGENIELNNRLEHFLDFKEKKISAARKKYIRNQILKGAALAGRFALAGSVVRHLSEAISDRIAVPPGLKETMDGVPGLPEQNPNPIEAEATGAPSAYLESTVEPGESPMEAPSVPNPSEAEATGAPSAYLESTVEPGEAPMEAPSVPNPSEAEATGEPSAYLKSTAESVDAVPAPASAPAPESAVPDTSPVSEEDWRADSGDSGSMKVSYQVQENRIPGESPLSELKDAASPRPVETISAEPRMGVEANNLHGRATVFEETKTEMPPEQQAAILNSDQSVADKDNLSQTTRDEIARQDAEALAELRNEPSPVSDEGTISKIVSESWNEGAKNVRLGTNNYSEGTISKIVSESWNEGAKNVRLGTNNYSVRSGESILQEVPPDSSGAGADVSDSTIAAMTEEGRVGLETEKTPVVVEEVEPNPLFAAEKENVDPGIIHEAEQMRTAAEVNQEYLDGRIGVGESIASQSPGSSVGEANLVSVESVTPDEEVVRGMVRSDEVREYLMTHPESIESFRKSLADYDTSIFESARGGIDMRGVANLSELNDKVEAKQVMYDCLKLIRDPLTPTYEIKTYQLDNSLNFDQMKNVGEFMVKATDRFGREAFPVENESLRAYLERMTALLVERGETMKLDGDTRFLKQLAFQSLKR